MDYISGNKFRDLAKWQYAPRKGEGVSTKNIFPHDDYRYIENTLKKNEVLDGDIIYTPTFFADSLLEELGDFNKKVVILTHNADNNMHFAPPDYVIKWYSQNVAIEHPRVYSIPIGLENDYWIGSKVAKMEEKLNETKKHKGLVYVNHNISTNPRQRQKPYVVLNNKSWATCEMGVNGQAFDKYLDNLYNHPFMVVPNGNGMDTHRLWECLYMGTIPIVIRDTNNSFYTDLPILFLDDWEEITEKFLFDSHGEISGRTWNMNKIYFKYWKDELGNYIVGY